MAAAERSVSVLGMGNMGSAIARVFVANGWKTTVWNRTTARSQPLVTVGATAALSANECVGASPLVIICLSQAQAFLDILETVKPVSSSGRILVNFTSGTFSEIEHCEQLASSLTFSAYIHAAIFATPTFVGLPDCASYYRGNEEAYRTVEPALMVLGRSIYLGPDTAAARFQEILMGGCFYGFAAGFLQTMATLRFSKYYTPGAAQKLMSDLIVPMLTQNFPRTFGNLAKQIDERSYVTKGTGVRIDLLAKALEGRVQTYTELGVSSKILFPLMELLETRLENVGSEEEEMSSLIEVTANPAKVSIEE